MNSNSNQSFTDTDNFNPNVQTSMDKSVENYAKLNPVKYNMAQHFGNYIMETPFMTNKEFVPVKPGVDITGEKILFEETIKNIKFNMLQEEDLNNIEIELLKKMYGDSWKKIFENE